MSPKIFDADDRSRSTRRKQRRNPTLCQAASPSVFSLLSLPVFAVQAAFAIVLAIAVLLLSMLRILAQSGSDWA